MKMSVSTVERAFRVASKSAMLPKQLKGKKVRVRSRGFASKSAGMLEMVEGQAGLHFPAPALAHARQPVHQVHTVVMQPQHRGPVEVTPVAAAHLDEVGVALALDRGLQGRLLLVQVAFHLHGEVTGVEHAPAVVVGVEILHASGGGGEERLELHWRRTYQKKPRY
jgi:hypothetical protein